MSGQQGLFDEPEDHPRQEAMDGALRKATPEWREQAYAIVTDLAKTRTPFSATNVWARGLPQLDDSRAIGAVFNQLARKRVIRSTGRVVVNPLARNGTSIREWVGA